MDYLRFDNVLKYFYDICKIPHGSGNMCKIAEYCTKFAEKMGLKYVRDLSDNVIIYKPATKGYENSKPVILQGHLDMVCQKEEGSGIDFLSDEIPVFVDGDFLTANGTTLGGDNGIAVAMILSILESDDIEHPPIEAVFTTDEEVGMLGAIALDKGLLSGKQMINLDSEEDDTLTVSCAGGSDFAVTLPLSRVTVNNSEITILISGLKGGHSGVEIDKGRVNSNILAARLLNRIRAKHDFNLISINGGDKPNAIPNSCIVKIMCSDADAIISELQEYAKTIKAEFSAREENLIITVNNNGIKENEAVSCELTDKIIDFLLNAPNGVIEMSAEIEGLVETSLNLGMLKTTAEKMLFHFALRSNKASALKFLSERLKSYSKLLPANTESFGNYPAWEYKENSRLQLIYKNCYLKQYGKEPKIAAIHAGLECAVFSENIENLDCVSMGPNLFDVHTVNERLSISSTKSTFELLLKILKELK